MYGEIVGKEDQILTIVAINYYMARMEDLWVSTQSRRYMMF